VAGALALLPALTLALPLRGALAVASALGAAVVEETLEALAASMGRGAKEALALEEAVPVAHGEALRELGGVGVEEGRVVGEGSPLSVCAPLLWAEREAEAEAVGERVGAAPEAVAQALPAAPLGVA
jgi:hypothetical protein